MRDFLFEALRGVRSDQFGMLCTQRAGLARGILVGLIIEVGIETDAVKGPGSLIGDLVVCH